MNFLPRRFSFLIALLIAFSIVPNSATTLPKHHKNEERDVHSGLRRPSSRSLLSLSPKVATTALVVTLDGTMYLVDRSPGSMKVIWSFSTGSPIYQSYKAPMKRDTDKENASAALMSGFVECGDDWSLYMHDRHFGKMRISESVTEYVARTPTLSDDGAVTLGSKKSTLFEVDAKTGSIVQIHAMSDPVNASAPWSDGRQSVTNIPNIKNRDLADPVKLNSPQPLLKIFRTDYYLQSVGPSSGIVLWTMALAEFQAVLLCQHSSSDIEDEYVSDSGLNFTMPYPCQEIRQVFRLKKNFLFEPSLTEKLLRDYHENDMLSMPYSNLMLPLQPHVDRLFNGDDDKMMLTQPLIEITTPREVYLNRTNEWPTPLPLVLFTVFLLVFSLIYPLVIKDQETLKDQNSESELKSSPAKKKKTHKSGRKNGIINKRENHLSLENENALTQRDNDREVWKHFSHVNENIDGRRIGKLFVSNNEIAKGSNGTIVLEGIYEGRAVAIKRLVKTHHDIAYKEIKNLIMSDRHPNIVRWHGVEYDNDFVYLALERCTCNLDDLVQIYSDKSVTSAFRKDQGIGCLIKSQMETGKDSTQCLCTTMPSTLFSLLFLLLLPFSTLSHFFSPPDNYLINCGSAVPSTLVDYRSFTGDIVDHRSPFPRAVSLRNDNPLPDLPPIYHTARVFTSPARYSFPITDKGTHIVRFHFHPFNSSNIDLGRAQFHVLLNGHVVLSNFTRLASGSRNPRIVEYLIWVDADSLVVVFVPNKDSKLAFVNAIEVISAPKDLVPDTARYLSQSKVEKFEGLNKQSLEVVYRVSVGGVKVTPFNDSLWRTWIPDDEFFKTRVGSEKLYFGGRIKYRVGGASREVGPDNVYNSARLIRSKNDSVPRVNMTWVFPVVGGYKYLVRLHFCDIASISLGLLYFNVYVNGYLAYQDLDLSYITNSLASPIYADFVVDGGDGALSVGVGPSRSSMPYLIDGILNAVEVMKLNNSLSSLDGEVCADSVMKSWSTGNSTGMLFTLVAAVCIVLSLSIVIRRKLLESRESVSWSRLSSNTSDDSVKN